jgi:cyanate lyase
MDEKSAEKLVHLLGVDDAATKGILVEPPLKGQTSFKLLMQDPCIYRFHEINLIYGLALKEVIQEKFGDGILSAIDFTMDVEKEGEPPRVKIVMSGKFLPYKKW